MRYPKAKRLCVVVVAAVILSCPACFGSEAGETAKTAPAVVAHFHLSGALSESPVPDPFGLMAGELTSLKDLVQRMNKASADS